MKTRAQALDLTLFAYLHLEASCLKKSFKIGFRPGPLKS